MLKKSLIFFISSLLVIPIIVSATTIKLQTPEVENLEDTFGYNGDGSPNHNKEYFNVGHWSYYGTWYTSYIKFNLSRIPSDMVIVDAVLALHGDDAGGGGTAGNVYVWEVAEQAWTEDTCYNPENCPSQGSYLNNTKINGGGKCGDYWYYMDVTPWVSSEYLDGKSNVSFALNVTYSVTGYTKLNSKESSDAPCRPYLNITYTKRPKWSANQSYNPTNYSPTKTSQFNITWQDNENVSVVLIEIRNSTGNVIVNNETMTNTYVEDIYNYSIVLPAGTLTWKSYANDTYNKWNCSDSWNITTGKSKTPLIITNNLNWSGTYPEISNTTGYCSKQLICNLYRNDTDQVTSPDNVLLGTGAYEYIYNTSGNENYSFNSTSNLLTITKGSLYLSINFTPSNTVTFPTETTVGGIETNDGDNDVVYKLWGDSILICNSSPYQDVKTLSVGSYSYKFNTSGGKNWSNMSVTDILTVQSSNTRTGGTYPGSGGILILPETPEEEEETTKESTIPPEEEVPEEEPEEEVPEEFPEEIPEEEGIQGSLVEIEPVTTAPTGLFLGNIHNWLISITIVVSIILIVILLIILKRRKATKGKDSKDNFKYVS